MQNAYIKFNAWTKIPPLTSENMQIFVNAGDFRTKQKFNAYCLNAKLLNRYGKKSCFANKSEGVNRALNAFFKQINPHFIIHYSDLLPHSEAVVRTEIGDFCVTDIGIVKGQNVGADGLFLVHLKGDLAHIYDCNNFFKIYL